MLAVGLALTASLCYGVANFLSPFLLRHHPLAVVLACGQVAACLAAVLALALSAEAAPSASGLALGIAAGAGNALGLVAFMEAVRFGPVSVVVPINAAGAVVPAIVGLSTGDPVTALRLAGLTLAVAGVILVARRPGGAAQAVELQPGSSPEASDVEPLLGPTGSPHDLRRCVTWSLISAAGFGLLLVALPAATTHGRWWALVLARVVIVTTVAVVIGMRRHDPRPPRRPGVLLALALPGLLLLTGSFLYTLAADHGDLSVVGVCGSLFPVVTVALALAILGERLSRLQFAGIAFALLGVSLLAV